jgi:hemin uptake protein HemP
MPLPPYTTTAIPAPRRTPAPPIIDSSALVGAAGTALIRHAGETYRLQVTRQNKLILTK